MIFENNINWCSYV